MRDSDRWRVACISALAACVLAQGAFQAQDEASLLYQARGNRHEGLRTIAVGGYDLELLSARIDTSQPRSAAPRAAPWTDTVHLRFYLPESDTVFVTIRQLRSGSKHYWLDHVQGTWMERMVNDFSWPTSPVLRQLRSVRLDDLGAAVRAGQDGPAKRERVLPALLFEANPPEGADGYRFVFKTNGRAKVTAVIYANGVEVYRRPGNWEQTNSPFTIVWSAHAVAEGWHRLVLSGYFEDNSPLDKEIVFYHRPRVADETPGGRGR